MHTNAIRVFATAVLTLPVSAQWTRLSLPPSGIQPTSDCEGGDMSADARFCVLQTYSDLFVPGDTNGVSDVFLFDRTSGTYTRVSVNNVGAQVSQNSFNGRVSDDGRYVAFDSTAPDLWSGAGVGTVQVYLRDLAAGTTTPVSVAALGGAADASGASCMGISGTGRFVFLNSNATNLVPGGSNGLEQSYVRDMQTGITTRVMPGLGNTLPDAGAAIDAFSPDGRYVVIESASTNLVPGDGNSLYDVFLRDQVAGTTTRVSVGLGGADGDGDSWEGAVSDNGRYVGFTSSADNLVPNDTNGRTDVFVRDLVAGTTERVSLDWTGAQLGSYSGVVRMSADGRYVAFSTDSYLTTPAKIDVDYQTFIRDRALAKTSWVSVNSAWEAANNGAFPEAISADGRFVLFTSIVDNFLPGDTNSAFDVYLRDRLQPFYADSDADGWGDPTTTTAPGISAPAGYTDFPFDCDDGNPAIHRGAIELCNGVDDDCDNQIDEGFDVYCPGAQSSDSLCIATIAATGSSSASATSGFVITVSAAEGSRMGTIFFGLAPMPGALTAGYRCVAAPYRRTPAQPTGGSYGSCDGSFSLDWNAFMANHPSVLGQPLFAGEVFYAQAAYRDSHGTPGFAWSPALRFALCP
jgi:Tol biopolymer transport system component